MKQQQFVVVSWKSQRRLVRISDLAEILPLMTLEPVDGAGATCRGVANLRGEVIPVFDLAGPDAPLSASRFILISSVRGEPVGLIVDEVHDVLTLPSEQLARRNLGAGPATTVARWGDELLTVIDPAEALPAHA